MARDLAAHRRRTDVANAWNRDCVKRRMTNQRYAQSLVAATLMLIQIFAYFTNKRLLGFLIGLRCEGYSGSIIGC